MLDRKKSQARVIAKLIDSSKVIVPSEATQAEEINVHPPINPTLIHVRSFLDMYQPGWATRRQMIAKNLSFDRTSHYDHAQQTLCQFLTGGLLSIPSSLVSSSTRRARRQLDVLRAHICRTSKLQVSARAVFFSETRWEGVGDRAREKRVKSGLRSWIKERQNTQKRNTEREKERNGENERAIKKGGKREGHFIAAGKRQSAGTHVESAKRSRSCVKCLDITVLFRPVRSSRIFSRFCDSVLFTLPAEHASRPPRNPFALSCPLVQIWWPSRPRFDNDSIVYGQLK